MKQMRWWLGLLLLVALPAVQAAPRVVVSIKPLHSLVAGVMAGVGEPVLLLSGGASPHAYALRPSEARALSEAELVVWVGPELEQFLVRPLATLGKGAERLTLAALPDITRLPVREGGTWEAHHHHGDEEAHGAHHHEGEAEHEGHADEAFDPHLWLDPENGRVLVQAVAERLVQLDPSNGARYRANAAALEARLSDLEQMLKAQLKPLQGMPFVVFHDAYHYFEARFGLEAVGSVTVSPERPPSARRVGEIRGRITALGARCVFAEPQFKPRLLDVLVEGTGARIGVLDPLGAALVPGPELYPQLLHNLADALTGCLTAGIGKG